MGYVKTEIKRLARQAGSKKMARDRAEDWYNTAINSRSIQEVHRTSAPFVPGKIYVFNYLDPVTPNLPWWDKNPVVLALDPVGGNDLGVNLNLLPVQVKEDLLDDLYMRLNSQIKASRNQNALRQNSLRITYYGMRAYLRRHGYHFAIRQYKRNIKTNQAVVAYEKWPDIALCDFMSLHGKNVWHLRREFRDWLAKN